MKWIVFSLDLVCLLCGVGLYFIAERWRQEAEDLHYEVMSLRRWRKVMRRRMRKEETEKKKE